MKRFILVVFILFSPLFVMAKDVKFSLVDYKGNLSYNDRFISSENFIKKLDVSKQNFSYQMVVENATLQKQKLFLLLESKSQDGSFDDLLDYLSIQVMVDDDLIYDGSASIMNYSNQKNDFRDFISLGTFSKKSSHTLKVEMTIDEEYYPSSTNQFAYIYFSFYTQKNKEYVEIEEVRNDMIYNTLDIREFSLICILVASLIFIFLFLRYRRKRTSILKKSKKEEKEEKK